MCGIFCVLNNFCNNCDNLISQLQFEANIKNRGPDSFNFSVASSEHGNLAFAASVLWLQGKSLTPQPVEDADSLFCYNGDIYSGFDPNLQKEIGDTKLFHDFFKEQLALNSFSKLQKLKGPYALIFYDKNQEKLYFGRDVFGRRSLLLGQNEEADTLVLTSVAKRKTQFDFIEVPSIGIFCYDLIDKKFKVEFWQHKNKNFYTKLKELERFLRTDVVVLNHFAEIDATIDYKFDENSNLALLKQFQHPHGVLDEPEHIFSTLSSCDTWMHNVKSLKVLLEKAVFQRVAAQLTYCRDCLKLKASSCKHATTGILFSGGVDCAILAALCHKFVDADRPIDLLNVSFDEAHDYDSPDRLTGRQTFAELKTVFPKRQWNFIEINVTKDRLTQERENHIADLIYPLNTVLDDSLGCALWFASRGESPNNYTSPCRILMVGMGADELFGGYSRHRTAFWRYSWTGLQEILDEDWSNLPYRNLGRDDRVVSDHGRQLRTPYLDENVVDFTRTSLSCWEKSCPSSSLPHGVGEKILLRSLAYHLGLKQAACLKKRALQFGSRIADPKENAHDVSPRLGF